VQEDRQVLEQADEHPEEEAEDGAVDRGAGEEGEEPRHELPEVCEAAVGVPAKGSGRLHSCGSSLAQLFEEGA